MNITLATDKDLNAVYQMASSCIEKMRAAGIDQWDAIYPNIYTFEKDIKEKSLFVSTENGLLIGSIVINERQEPEYETVNWQYREGKICVIHRLMVRPELQGRGIAKELMYFAEYLAKERGYHSIRLDTFFNNSRALNFYQHLNYTEVGHVFFRKGKFICFEKRL